MKKKIMIYTICIVTIFGLCGCAAKKENVKLKTEREIVKYASNKYGKAIYVSKKQKNDSIKYTLQDKEYKFNYECSSSITQFCIDGSCAESYFETSNCYFDRAYQQFILDKLDLNNIYENFSKNYPSNSSTNKFIFAVKYENEKVAKANVAKLAKKFKKIDKRKYFKDYHIAIYDNNDNYLGIYNTTLNKYINRYEEAAEGMTYSFATVVNHRNDNLDGIKYLYYKRIQYKDVENFKIEWLQKSDVTAEDWTTAYYFDYKGRTYFMLDDKVFITDQSIFNRYIADEYYTSYWFTN